MKFHLLALPNTQTTSEYSLDGFAMLTIRFARILKELGHFVYLYASEENEAPCDELIKVITKEEQRNMLGNCEYQNSAIEGKYPLWALSNKRIIEEIGKRKQPRDFICSIGGTSQKQIADAFPDLMFVEYSIGYIGSFSKYRVFESYAWMHNTYGVQNIGDGRFYDTVIPGFFSPDEFPFQATPDEYALYVGRLVERKGIGIACEAASKAGIKLKIIGHGDPKLITGNHEYLGPLSGKERNEIMSRARAVFCPTIYIEPFNCVAVEAQMCGTPVISTDFGGFTETVEQGKTGFRCSILKEFVEAIHQVKHLDRKYIRERAIKLYSMEAVKSQYQKYFDRLMTLWDAGWYSDQVGIKE